MCQHVSKNARPCSKMAALIKFTSQQGTLRSLSFYNYRVAYSIGGVRLLHDFVSENVR